MTILQAVLLGTLQGAAEFLPISSSGHLSIVQALWGLQVPLLFDIFLHLATLLAVVIFFRSTIYELLYSLYIWVFCKQVSQEKKLKQKANQTMILAIVATTFVTGAIGVVVAKKLPDFSPKAIGGCFLVTAVLLFFCVLVCHKKKTCVTLDKTSTALDKNCSPLDEKQINTVTIKQGFFIGLAQGLGTLPGISRSGATIAGALFCGCNKDIAGSYSFVASIPAILGAFLLEAKDIGQVKHAVGVLPLLVGCIVAFASGYFALHLFMKMIKKGNFLPFSAYLFVAGILTIFAL